MLERPKILFITILSLIPGLHILVYFYILRKGYKSLQSIYLMSNKLSWLGIIFGLLTFGWSIQRFIINETRVGARLIGINVPHYLNWIVHLWFIICISIGISFFFNHEDICLVLGIAGLQFIVPISVYVILGPFSRIFDVFSDSLSVNK